MWGSEGSEEGQRAHFCGISLSPIWVMLGWPCGADEHGEQDLPPASDTQVPVTSTQPFVCQPSGSGGGDGSPCDSLESHWKLQVTAYLRSLGQEGCSERGTSIPEPPHPCPQTAAAMATLYPSLEDMKGHQVLQAQAAAGVRTPATTVVTEKPKLTSGTGKVGPDQLTLCRGSLGGE